MSDLTTELKNKIIQELEYSNEFDDVQPDTPLFNNPYISLDSIDAIRIIVMVQKDYGIRIQDMMQGRKILYSIDTIAEFIEESRRSSSKP